MADFIPQIGSRQFVGWFFQPDDKLGWKMVPGRDAWYVKSGIKTRVQTNSYGFRGADFAIEKPAGTRRILVLADSFGAAIEIDEPNIFARVMERTLNDRWTQTGSYQVINAGVGGYGTEQELLFLKEIGQTFKPDIVLVCFHFGDDLIENSAELCEAVTWRLVKLPRPHLEAGNDGNLKLVNNHPPANHIRRAWRHYYDLLPWECWTRLGLSNNPLWVQAMGRLGRRATEIIRARWNNSIQKHSFPVELRMYSDQPGPLYEQAWQHTEHLFKGFQKTLYELGAKLVVAGICAKEQVLPGYLQSRLNARPPQAGIFSPDVPGRQFEVMLRRLNIPHLDLTSIFSDRIRAGDSLFFERDLHWNECGHALAGEKLVEAIATL